MKRHSVVLVLALLAAAVAVEVAPAGTKVAACKTSDLVVWMDTTGDATAGSTYFALKFTNQSGHACTLSGYPGVSALDLHGHQLGSPASRDSSAVHVRHLANGDTVSAVLRIVDALNFPASTCGPRPAAGLRVYPPNQTSSKVVPLPFEGCSRSGPRVLSVKAVS